FVNAGSFTKSAGTGTIEVDVPFNSTGSVSVSSGTLSLAAGGTNAGNVTVASGTTLSAAGYTQTAGSTSLDGGTLAGGPFTINGAMNIALINGYHPATGNAFLVLTYGGRSGSFAAIHGLGIGQCQILGVTYNPNDVTLTVQADHPPVVGAITAPLSPTLVNTA